MAKKKRESRRREKTASLLEQLRHAIARGASIGAVVSLLNDQHAVVREGGKTTIITETYDPVLHRYVLMRASFGDFRNYYLSFQMQVGASKQGQAQFKTIGNIWLEHSDRRQYEGIVFAPLTDKPGYFNLWRGYAVEPIQGDWSLMARHVMDVICHGDEELYRYVVGWMAHRVQRPGDPAEVALVMRGPRGSGKGVFARQFGMVFGQHFVHVSHSRHLTGNFNAHLQDAVVIFADEAFGTSNRAGEGVLKMLITEPYIPIERKGRDLAFTKNCAGVIMASNSAWVVPAGLDERRFCVLEVSGVRAQDHEYFRQLVTQMDAGGREAMLFDLSHIDLDDVDLRKAPATTALHEQKLFSMHPHERWWYQKLRDGQLLSTHDKWHIEVMRDPLHEDYSESLGKSRNQATATELGLLLKGLVPGLGETRKSFGGTRKWYWVFPPLADCRARFDEITRTKHDWPSEEGLPG